MESGIITSSKIAMNRCPLLIKHGEIPSKNGGCFMAISCNIYSLGISIVFDCRRVTKDPGHFLLLGTGIRYLPISARNSSRKIAPILSKSIHVDTLYIFSAIPDPSWIPIFSRDIRQPYASPISWLHSVWLLKNTITAAAATSLPSSSSSSSSLSSSPL